jgi:hypothetical protein
MGFIAGRSMPGPEIPGTDHVCRLCGKLRCDDDGQPLGDAFMLRRDEPYLSTNWLECTGAASRADQLTIIRQHLTDKGMTLKASARLAVLHLQTVIDYVRSGTPDARTLAAHYEPQLPPDPPDPSHSGIYGYTADEQAIADLIAQVVEEIHNAKG